MKRIKYELWEVEGLLYILVGLQLTGLLKILLIGYGIITVILGLTGQRKTEEDGK